MRFPCSRASYSFRVSQPRACHSVYCLVTYTRNIRHPFRFTGALIESLTCPHSDGDHLVRYAVGGSHPMWSVCVCMRVCTSVCACVGLCAANITTWNLCCLAPVTNCVCVCVCGTRAAQLQKCMIEVDWHLYVRIIILLWARGLSLNIDVSTMYYLQLLWRYNK